MGCYLAGDAVEACPPTLGYRVRKAYRRNRPVILTGGAFAVVLLAAAGVSLAFGVLATRAGREAEARREESDDHAVRADRNADTAKANEDRAEREASNVRAEQDRTRRLLHASEMNHAFLDALEFRTGRVRDRLAAAVPKPGEPDLRGWEWHHLDRLAHSWTAEVTLDAGPLAGRTDLFVRQGGAGPTNRSVAELAGAFFTADGTRLVIPAARPVPIPGVENPDRKDGPGGVFDTKTGKLLSTHAAKSAFSADGAWVASPKGGAARVVRLTEIATNREVDVDLGAAEGERGGPPRVGLGGQRVTATTVVWGKPLVRVSKEQSEKLKEVAPEAPRDFAVGRFKFQPIDALHVAVWTAGRPLEALRIAGPKDGTRPDRLRNQSRRRGGRSRPPAGHGGHAAATREHPPRDDGRVPGPHGRAAGQPGDALAVGASGPARAVQRRRPGVRGRRGRAGGRRFRRPEREVDRPGDTRGADHGDLVGERAGRSRERRRLAGCSRSSTRGGHRPHSSSPRSSRPAGSVRAHPRPRRCT